MAQQQPVEMAGSEAIAPQGRQLARLRDCLWYFMQQVLALQCRNVCQLSAGCNAGEGDEQIDEQPPVQQLVKGLALATLGTSAKAAGHRSLVVMPQQLYA